MIVIVHGYDGSGPGHWQRWLADELHRMGAPFVFPELAAPEAPQCAVWVAELRQVVAAAATPVTFVCHSLGCWAVDHLLAERGAAGVRAALLVAPPSPYLMFEPVESFLPPPRRRVAWESLAAASLLIGSDDDDFTSAEEFAEIAAALGVAFEPIAGAGHINVASGFGPWPRVLEWLRAVGALDDPRASLRQPG